MTSNQEVAKEYAYTLVLNGQASLVRYKDLTNPYIHAWLERGIIALDDAGESIYINNSLEVDYIEAFVTESILP